MNILQIFAIEAFLLLLLLLYLSIRVIGHRRSKRVAVGDNNDISMTRAIGAQTNFLNYVPMALIFQLVLILLNINVILFLILALLLLVGRTLHAYSLHVAELRPTPTYLYRMIAMYMTFASLLFSGIALLFYVF